MKAEDALLAIQELLDGVEWDSRTTDKIAEIMVQAGYRIRDLDDEDFIVDATSILNHPKSDIVRTVAEARGIPVVEMKLSRDPERIWLEPAPGGPEGRTWCEDKVWPIDVDDEPTEYIRKDLFTKAAQGAVNLMETRDQLKAVLKELVSDITSMQPHSNPENYWFGPFGAYEENCPSGGDFTANVEWPNLAISTEKAEALLKELECPSSNSSS